MASSMLVIKVTCLAMICLVLCIPLANASLTCDEVKQNLTPCLPYVTNPHTLSPPDQCCNGVKTVNDNAQIKPDRQDVCRCLKSLLTGVPGLNGTVASTLPSDCGINFRCPIGPDMDCDKYISHHQPFFSINGFSALLALHETFLMKNLFLDNK
ncbi:Lipid transfer protein [Medicago truncatula]|uniref:Non-specific lipid-transfer protein n=1 Tax=Medicago truncatula TaxID=3880 RepID=G7KX68_MEDTR|nr:Lipid transfer protein [Medicago truncatula]